MIFNTLLENLSANPWLLFMAFSSFLLSMHLVLVSWLKLGDLAWKRVDYVWLAATGLGVFVLSAEAGRQLSVRYLVGERFAAQADYDVLRQSLDRPAGVCMPRVRSEFSPANFDEVVREQKILCRRAQALFERLPAAPENFPVLDDSTLAGLSLGIRHETLFVDELSRHLVHYQNSLRQYKIFAAKNRVSEEEFLYVVLGPLLLAFALALRITKVTGEIFNAKQRVETQPPVGPSSQDFSAASIVAVSSAPHPEQSEATVLLRSAVPEDAPLLRCWDDATHVLAANPNDDWEWEAELLRSPPWREQMIAEVDGRAIGFVQIIDPALEDGHYWGDVPAHLRAVDIWIGEADARGRGHGGEMMRQTLARCFAPVDVEAVLIDPLASNVDAIRFYRRMGFEFVKVRDFGDDHCHIHRLSRERYLQLLAQPLTASYGSEQ